MKTRSSHVIVPLVAAAALTIHGQAASQPPDILVLYADDWRHDTLGCAGNPVVKTPHLDRLASQGMRFTQNCVTTSICGVSRACLFYWPEFELEQLFHVAADPFEQNDLARDPAQAERLAEMRARFAELKAGAK